MVQYTKKNGCDKNAVFLDKVKNFLPGDIMRQKNGEAFSAERETICPLRLVMDIIGGKWKMNILCLLKDGKPLRYNQIKRGVLGITNMMLANSLKSFEEYGIVHREQYNEVPVRVEYRLTAKGLELIEALRILERFGSGYISESGRYESHCRDCLYFDGGCAKQGACAQNLQE